MILTQMLDRKQFEETRHKIDSMEESRSIYDNNKELAIK